MYYSLLEANVDGDVHSARQVETNFKYIVSTENKVGFSYLLFACIKLENWVKMAKNCTWHGTAWYVG